MFTGIIEEIGIIESIIRKGGGLTLAVSSSKINETLKIGDSVAVNGVCLTVVKMSGRLINFQVMLETVKNTNLSLSKKNDKVNLERALRLDSRLDGHFVQGHIDCSGKLIGRVSAGAGELIDISYPQEYIAYTAPRGSITLDGVSLTIAEKHKKIVRIGLVDFTLGNTTLGTKKIGDNINIEFDIIGKYLFEFYRGYPQK